MSTDPQSEIISLARLQRLANERSYLRALLITRQSNLHKLENQAAMHGASGIPLDLLNGIEGEKKEIGEAEASLQQVKETIEGHLYQLYVTADRAALNKDWTEAIHLFERMLGIGEPYKDTRQKLAEVKKQQQLVELYSQGIACFKAEEWQKAIGLFHKILEIDPSYQDTPQKLTEAKKQQQLVELYSQGVEWFQGEAWQQAIRPFQQILDIDRSYKDASQRLVEAKKQKRLAELYRQGVTYFEAEEWQRAIDLSRKILEINRNYKDVPQKLAEAQKQQQLAELYGQGMQHFQSEAWQQAIGLFNQILDLDKSYKDASQKLVEAKKRLRRAYWYRIIGLWRARLHSKSLWLLVVVTAGMLVWGAWLMRNSQSISQQVSIKEFLVGRDGSSFISVKPGTIITVTVEEIVHIKVKVSITDQEQEDLLFVWYTCSKGDNPARQSRGNPEWLYVAPGEPGSDCLRILIEKGDAQLDQAEIFLDIQN